MGRMVDGDDLVSLVEREGGWIAISIPMIPISAMVPFSSWGRTAAMTSPSGTAMRPVVTSASRRAVGGPDGR
jgi:hypothetical protein